MNIFIFLQITEKNKMVIYVKTEKDKKKQIKKSSYIMRCWFFFFLINLPNSDT